MDPISPLLASVVGDGSRLAFSAYDGSSAGHPDAAVRIVIRDPRALRYIASAPGDLGLARAYVTGSLEVEGDLFEALELVSGEGVGDLSLADRFRVIRGLGPAVLVPPELPAEEWRRRSFKGLRHSSSRDSRAVSHHYDVSNRFYSLVLGPSMAYTCAVYPGPGSSLEEAQEEKVDLVCRKLDLRPGCRLLDVGCGWGTMVVHAAKYYGARVLGVTLSRQQADWGQKWLAEEGLSDRAEIRYSDYRHVTESSFDAVSSIGLTEHIGARNLGSYASFLASRLKPRGRLLNHCITRPTTTASNRTGNFMNRYIFPDGELEGVGAIVSARQDNGLEVRHEENFREHYERTCAAWGANLDLNWEQALEEVGVGRARVWKLYLAASRLGFAQRRIELHQVLATRTSGGASGMPFERCDFGRSGESVS